MLASPAQRLAPHSLEILDPPLNVLAKTKWYSVRIEPGALQAFTPNIANAKQRRIQDFPGGGGGGGANIRFCQNFPKNCMKLKEFGRPGGGRPS